LRAALVFLDESGMLMAPLVRRSWSLRGHTPVMHQRGRCLQKVSAIAALCIPPTRDRITLYFRLHADANVNAERAMDFLEHLQRQLRLPIVLIWDRFQAHKGELINECVLPRSAHLEYLPPYAPELNPVEYLWSWLKTNPLANHPAVDLYTLTHRTRRAALSVQRRPDLLRAFFRHTGLSLRLH
jgi:transposase